MNTLPVRALVGSSKRKAVSLFLSYLLNLLLPLPPPPARPSLHSPPIPPAVISTAVRRRLALYSARNRAALAPGS